METKLKTVRSATYSAILKPPPPPPGGIGGEAKGHGIAKFKLEILEYCSPKNCIELEQEYMNLLTPEYNILKIAGSCLGVTRNEETRAKMSVAKKGENHPNYGKPKPEGSGTPSQEIVVFDNKNNKTTTYESIRAAARDLEINMSIISNYFRRNQQKPYKGRYTFKRF
jgi:hypothetical protein